MEETAPMWVSYVVAGIGYAVIALVIFLVIRSRRSRQKNASSIFSEEKESPSALNSLGSAPRVKGGFRAIDWILPFFTAGISLIFSFHFLKQRREENQKKLDRLWAEYLNWRNRAQEPFAGFDYLFNGDSLVSDANGVVLEEARQGDTTTVAKGDIRLRGGTSTVGVGVGVGALGVGVASSQTSLSGTLNSEGKSTVGKDVARDIDKGQLIAGQGHLNFLGNLQTRDIPLEDLLNVRRDFHVVLVSARSLPVTQRFRFIDRFEAQVFEHALSGFLKAQELPSAASLVGEMESAAQEYVQEKLNNLEEKMRRIVAGA